MDECVPGTVVAYVHSQYQYRIEQLKCTDYQLQFAESRVEAMSVIVFSIVPCFANILTLSLLLRGDVGRLHATLRRHLLLLSTSEVTFTICIFLYLLVRFIIQSVRCGEFCTALYCVFGAVTSSAEASRNWCVAAITVARCETVVRPLKSREQRKVLGIPVIYVVAALFASGALVVGFVEKFHPKFFVICYFDPPLLPCDAPDINGTQNFTQEYPSPIKSPKTTVRLLLALSYNRIVPVIVIIISSIILSVKILDKSHMQGASQAGMLAAAKMVFLLGVVFSALECVVIFFVFQPRSPVINMYIFDKFLVLLNSLSNIFAFLYSNKQLRVEIIHILGVILCCGRSNKVKPEEASQNPSTLNAMVLSSVNPTHTSS